MDRFVLDLPITDGVLQLTVLVAAALAVQLTLERIHLPGITGLLLIGMLIGPGGAELLPREPVVSLLGSIGLVYIMFLAGLEVDLEVASEHTREVVGFGVLSFVLPFLLAAGLGWWAGFGAGGALLIGAAFSSHTLLSYPVVEGMGLAGRRPMVTAIGGTLLTDTLALVSLVLIVAAFAGGRNEASIGGPVSLLLLLLLVVVAVAVVPRAGSAFLASGASREEKALFVFMVLLALSSAAELIGTEDILGAFLAGLCLNGVVRGMGALHEHVAFVGRMLFIPFFFVETGMRLELVVLRGGSGVWVLSAALLGAVVAGKAGATWVAGRLFGYDLPERGVMLGLTLPQAAATLAVTVVAAESGLLDELAVDAVILVILATSVAGPMLTRLAGERMDAA
jgi:Kef-type K+ transport system membrane component KefB